MEEGGEGDLGSLIVALRRTETLPALRLKLLDTFPKLLSSHSLDFDTLSPHYYRQPSDVLLGLRSSMFALPQFVQFSGVLLILRSSVLLYSVCTVQRCSTQSMQFNVALPQRCSTRFT